MLLTYIFPLASAKLARADVVSVVVKKITSYTDAPKFAAKI